MRDLALVLFVFGMIPVMYFRPFIGLLMWVWISYMLPHKLAWSFAVDFRFVYIIALVTIAGMVMNRSIKFSIPIQAPTNWMMLFLLWTTLTTIMAAYPDKAWPEWERFIKIQAMVLVTLIMVKNKNDINVLVWVIVLSLGFWGVKGGLWTVIHGGVNRVYGPPGSFFYDNNTLALTLNMVIPLMGYLNMHASSRTLRWTMLGILVLTLVAVLGTYSRGGALGAVAMVFFLWLKNLQRIVGSLIVMVFLVGAYQFMPEQWNSRMTTIANTLEYQEKRASKNESELAGEDRSETIPDLGSMIDMIKNPDLQDEKVDQSVRGRLNAWSFVLNMIEDYPILGGGFNVFARGQMYWDYAVAGSIYYNDAHSIYFEVLGEQGIPGLVMFLAMYLSTFRLASRTIRIARPHKELGWARDLSAMLQVSMVGYLVNGLTLGMAYFDVPYHLISIVVIVHVASKKELEEILKRLNRDAKPRNSIFAPR